MCIITKFLVPGRPQNKQTMYDNNSDEQRPELTCRGKPQKEVARFLIPG